MNIVIRTDSSVVTGSGHLMRCLTLADYMAAQGHSISFICADLAGHQAGLAVAKGYRVDYVLPRILHSFENCMADAAETLRIITSFNITVDWLIVDHYGIEACWEEKARNYINRLMVIDDLANRRHACDVLLDQNIQPEQFSRYAGLVPPGCLTLLGPQYALLRPEFSAARKYQSRPINTIRHVLITFGGSDPTNETMKVLRMLSKFEYLNLIVVVGASNPHADEIEQYCKFMPAAKVYCGVNNMAELMNWADLAIGAAGSTTWERLCMGLPSIVISIAENQNEIAVECHKRGLLKYLGAAEVVSEDDIFNAVAELVGDPSQLQAMARRGQALVDGGGTYKVYEALRSVGGMDI